MEMVSLLNELALRRPIFHSEADFQQAFAWEIQVRYPGSIVRLETRPLRGEAIYLDVFAVANEFRVAVELKYLVRSLDLTIMGERFLLRNQGAHDVRRYDVVKDISRIESLVERDIADVGFVIALSNDPAYWTQGTKADPIDKDFRLHEGKLSSGKRSWSSNAGAGTTRGRPSPITLEYEHVVRWHDYPAIGDTPKEGSPATIGDTPKEGSPERFRYLAVEVQRAQRK